MPQREINTFTSKMSTQDYSPNIIKVYQNSLQHLLQ